VEVRVMTMQTIFLVSFVLQATFALTLGLLAVTDRRSRGLLWLAATAVLHLLATATMEAWRHHPLPPLGVFGVCVLVLLFFCGYKGIQHFLAETARMSGRDWLQLGVALAAVGAVYAVNRPASLVLARVAAIAWMVATLRLLFTTKLAPLQRAARVAGVMLAVTMVCIVLRVVTGLQMPGTSVGFQGVLGSVILVSGWLSMLGCMGLYMAEAQQRMYVETRLDALTGLDNRRSMEEMAEREVHWAAQSGAPLSLLMIDADHFKQLNDTWGHSLGDKALQAMAQALVESVRSGGRVARMGGEEFAVLLPHTDAAAAMVVSERLRRTVEELRVMEGDEVAPLTVSIGVSLRAEGEASWTEMLRRADIALYRAKREGRNRVVLAGEKEAMPPVGFTAGLRTRARWMRGYSLATLTQSAERGRPSAQDERLLQGEPQDAAGVS
jgi:diguanylate cyclase (GGDEF)-like protein